MLWVGLCLEKDPFSISNPMHYIKKRKATDSLTVSREAALAMHIKCNGFIQFRGGGRGRGQKGARNI